MRASEFDVEDVTVRRLLQSLTPSVSAVQPLPLVITSTSYSTACLLHSLAQVIRLVSLR